MNTYCGTLIILIDVLRTDRKCTGIEKASAVFNSGKEQSLAVMVSKTDRKDIETQKCGAV